MQAAAEAWTPCAVAPPSQGWDVELNGLSGLCVLDVELVEQALGPAHSPLLRSALLTGQDVGLVRQRLPSCHTWGKSKAMRPRVQRKSRGLDHCNWA